MNFIIDASIALKIILEGDVAITTRLFHRSKKFQTSPIFYLECANAIKQNYDSIDLAKAAFERLLTIPIEIIPISGSETQAILEMSHRNKTTTYDTSYHHLAIENDGLFITNDEKYYQAASHLGHIELWG